MSSIREKITKDGSLLTRYHDGIQGNMNVGEYPELKRENLYRSDTLLSKRDWSALFSLPEATSGDFSSLEKLHQDCIDKVVLNNRVPDLDNIRNLNRPKMIAEFGFGNSTYVLLKWCAENDGYLITTEMPIAPDSFLKKDEYNHMYWWGVDRYWRKYEHCIALLSHPIARKRWLWLNENAFEVTKKMINDENYRRKLFHNGIVDCIFEDAVHDTKYCQDLWDKIKPYMSSQSIFYGYKVGVFNS